MNREPPSCSKAKEVKHVVLDWTIRTVRYLWGGPRRSHYAAPSRSVLTQGFLGRSPIVRNYGSILQNY